MAKERVNRFRGCGRMNGEYFTYCLNCMAKDNSEKCREIRSANEYTIQDRRN